MLTVGLLVGCCFWLFGWPVLGSQSRGVRRALTVILRLAVLAAAMATMIIADQFSPVSFVGFVGVVVCGVGGFFSFLGLAEDAKRRNPSAPAREI